MRVNIWFILFIVGVILILELLQLATGCGRLVCCQEQVVWSTSRANIPEPEILILLVTGMVCLACWEKFSG